MTNENITGNILATCCALILMVFVEPVKAFGPFKGKLGSCSSIKCLLDTYVQQNRLLIGAALAVLLAALGVLAAFVYMRTGKSKKRISTRKTRK